jgi:predicted Zn-dependent protease
VRVGVVGTVCALLCASAFAQSAGRSPNSFGFTQVDLDFLTYCNQLDQQFEDHHLVYDDPELTKYVTAVGTKVLPPGAAPEHVVWRFRVLKNSLPNAFALANGSIYVHTGMLALLENEAQLASVLAHEETHVLNYHGYLENRNLRQKTVDQEVFSAIGAGAGAFGGLYGSLASAALNGVTSAVTVSAIYGYSRELEEEADVRAVAAMAQAGYDPQQMVVAFRLLDSNHEVDLSRAFYQDHPKLMDRIAYISTLADTTHPSGAKLLIETEPYAAATQEVTRENVAWDIEGGRQRMALADARKLVAEDPGVSANFRVLGDAWRALGPRTPDPTLEELSSHGKGEARKLQQKFTLVEYDNYLMGTPAGQANWENNSKQSEDAYRKALELDPANANAHRGLGLLYEKERLPGKAAQEFQKYLDATQGAPDEAQIRHRLEIAKAQAQTHPATSKP